jgi:hypothetical protein
MTPHEEKGAERHPAEHAKFQGWAAFLRKLKASLRRIEPRRRVVPAHVPRPGDVGIDVPAGASARDLRPADYRPVEMENDRPSERPPEG